MKLQNKIVLAAIMSLGLLYVVHHVIPNWNYLHSHLKSATVAAAIKTALLGDLAQPDFTCKCNRCPAGNLRRSADFAV